MTDVARRVLVHLSESTVARTLVTRTPLRGMARRFVAGESVAEALDAVRAAHSDGLQTTANYLGEAVHDEPAARAAAERYVELLSGIAADGIPANASLKFTQLGQAIGDAFLRDNLGKVLDEARRTDAFVRFDMESSAYTQATVDAFTSLWEQGARNIGIVLQAYLRRTEDDVRLMNRLGARVRLCKGAYVEPPEVAFQSRREVDGSFLRCMRLLLSGGNYPAIATHDDAMIDGTLNFATQNGFGPDSFEFQMLHGVRRDLQARLKGEGYTVRVYVPFGEAWYPYLMRRMAERPANLLFVLGSVVRESRSRHT